MSGNGKSRANLILAGKLGERGLRLTSRRALVYRVVSSMPGHPSVEEIYAKIRQKTGSISLATVYNCLEMFVECGMIRAVHRGRMGACYCTNEPPHAHLHLSGGSIVDVPLSEADVRYIRALVPREYEVDDFDLNFSGEKGDLPETAK